jgi:hypothetical protein
VRSKLVLPELRAKPADAAFTFAEKESFLSFQTPNHNAVSTLEPFLQVPSTILIDLYPKRSRTDGLRHIMAIGGPSDKESIRN